jgi:hypothetical protein
MGLFLFVAVISLVVGGPLVLFLWRSKLRPDTTNMVLIGAAAGEAEVGPWVAALRSAGIASHVKNVGSFSYPPGLTTAYAYEVWVRARDEARAREALGL